MKSFVSFFVGLFVLLSAHPCFAVDTVEEYDNLLPIWGTSWKKGQGGVSHYYPSFYTGFAPRSQSADRIHIRTSRGNQTRVSVILDTMAVQDYLFDLATRYAFYKEMTTTDVHPKVALNTSPSGASLLPQVKSFQSVIESSTYGVFDSIAGVDSTQAATPEFYKKSLETMAELNPGRVFQIKLDLNKEFARWTQLLPEILDGKRVDDAFTQNSEATVVALNTLVWGRVNYTAKPSVEVVADLRELANKALNKEADFVTSAVEFFKQITGDKYNFQVVINNSWSEPIHCQSGRCWLEYAEFTAIYPTGSMKGLTTDQYGNRIPNVATPGLWQFYDRQNSGVKTHDVDQIRREGYYGWAPKMNYETPFVYNGFHNPAVRFTGKHFNQSVKTALGAPQDHQTLWAVKRGGVSSGCLRLAHGHIWEMRHIMPVENSKMVDIYFFGNSPFDFDLYDVDGDGQLEVMGVEYMISYNTQGSSGLAKRDGKNLEVAKDTKDGFYNKLYGSKNVFEAQGSGYLFVNPSVSFPSHMDYEKKKTKTSFTMAGNFPLYEQTYERDKTQFYNPIKIAGLQNRSQESPAMRLVRLMGRVKGCAPSSDPINCGGMSFADEKAEVLPMIGF